MKRTTTIRWDTEEKQHAAAALAKRRGLGSVNRLINSIFDTILAQEAAEKSFRAAAKAGKPAELLEFLDRLDAEDKRQGIAGTQP